jgi:phosphoenolpyruvate-protein kinase (PTS system EI component)
MIVARDLGLPAVVAAVGATTAIKTGDLVEVDGSAGVVRILERA